MRYVYFGTSEFAAIILKTLLQKNMAPVAVVTQPDRAAGRGKKPQPSPVAVLAKLHTLPLLQPEKLDGKFLMDVRIYTPDLFLVAAYGKLIPKNIFDYPTYKTLNVHPSLLPLYRGPSPIQTAILEGERKTGVTIILLDEKMDHGPMLTKESIPITPDDTTETLSEKLAVLSGEMLLTLLPRWVTHTVKPVPQDDTQALFSKILAKEDGHLDWTKTAQELERHIRAMTPWPGSWMLWEQKGKKLLLKIKKVRILSETTEGTPGTVLPLRDDLLPVICGEDLLGIETLQPQGKKAMSARAFVNGYPNIIGSLLQ